VALRPLLRGGASDAELLDALCAALQHKPRQHHFGDSGRHLIRIMSRTGG
jgi:cyclic pyranopterin phosphate synthase